MDQALLSLIYIVVMGVLYLEKLVTTALMVVVAKAVALPKYPSWTKLWVLCLNSGFAHLLT